MQKAILFIFLLLFIGSCKKRDSVPVLTDGYMRAYINGNYVDAFTVDRSHQSGNNMCIDGLIINEEGKYDFSKATSAEILIYVNTPSISIGKHKVGGRNYTNLGTCRYYQVYSGDYIYSSGAMGGILDSGYVYITKKNDNSITGTFEFVFHNDESSGDEYSHITKGEFKVPTY